MHPPHRRLAGILLAGWGSVAIAACEPVAPAGTQDVAVAVDGVAVDQASGMPVVILAEEAGGGRSLPIWIGVAEAHAIANEMQHVRPPRPNTHDLAKRLLDRLEGTVERVVVTELRDATYYAVVVLSSRGAHHEIDARPSDAIALALRCGAPVYVRERVFEQSERAAPPDPDEHST